MRNTQMLDKDKYKPYVNRINATPFKVAVVLAGGGQSFAFHFMKYAGASKTIVDISIPYSKEAFEEYCGKPISQYVSPETSRLLAVQAYLKCCKSIEPKYAIGLSLTCSLATNNERSGRLHRIYVGLHTLERTVVRYIELEQGLSREDEESFCCDLLFDVLNKNCGLPYARDLNNFPVTVLRTNGWSGNSYDFVTTVDDSITNLVLAPGSYNPFHSGHEEFLELAAQILGAKPILEITNVNADKGILDHIELKQRIKIINNGWDVIVTSARTFLDKAKQFARPDRTITFVLGADTWNRVLDPKYAGEMKELFSDLVELRVRFLVFPRGETPILSNGYMDQLRIFDVRTALHTNTTSSTEIREGKV